jgi:RNA polymerase sigma factor (sigma-70 family)
MDDDAALLASYAQTRDAEVFRVLIDRHAGLVFGTCLRVCGNRADADDAAQEVFIALGRAAERIHGHLPAWLHQVAIRVAMHIRRRRRGRQLDPTIAAGEPDEVRTLLPQLDTAIAGLPEDERRCVVARYLEGRTQQEIAAELGLSQPTVHRRLETAVERLRGALGASGHHCVAVLALATMPVPSTVQVALGKIALVGPTPVTAATGGAGGGLTTTLVVAGALAAGIAVSVVFLQPAPRKAQPPIVTAPVAQPVAPTTTPTSQLPVGTWTAITPPVRFVGGPAGVLSISIDPQQTTTLYAGIEAKTGGDHADGNGLWRSRDGGASWTLLGARDSDTSDDRSTALDMPIAVAVDPRDSQHLYATEGVRGNNQGFWISTDAGASWTRTWRGSLTTLAVDPHDFRHVLTSVHLGQDGHGILESHDGGPTWTQHPPVTDAPGGSHSPAFLCDPATKQGDGRTWLVQHGGLWRTSDAGATWRQVSDDPGHNGLRDGAGLHYCASGRLYRAAGPRLLRSSDNGSTWEDVTGDLPHATYYSITGDGRSLWLMPDGYPPDTTWLSATDSGMLTWTAHRGGGQAQRGPLTLRFDSRNRIIYSANWSAGLWALRMP